MSKDERAKPVVMLTIANNAEKTLRRCIDSVLDQKCESLLYYVCDNGSADGTRSIINEYAENDTRVVPILCKDNCWRLIELVSTILLEHEDGYFAVLDADDEYKPGFLEKMLAFIRENDLGLALCGSDDVNADTDELCSRKELGYDLVLTGKSFLTEYLNYRRYIYDFWGKLYTIPTLRRAYIDYCRSNVWFAGIGRNFELFNYSVLKSLKRAGVLGESLHKHYVYPDSQSTRFFPGRIEASVSVYYTALEFLTSFGEVDSVTQDYLYAVYLGQINEVMERLISSDLSLAEKRSYMSHIFSHPLTNEMMAHEAGIQFRNLSERHKFKTEMEKLIAAGGA